MRDDLSKGSLLLALNDTVSDGVLRLVQWTPASPSDRRKIILDHASRATSLSPVLLEFMRAPQPAGLAMSDEDSQSALKTMLELAAELPQ